MTTTVTAPTQAFLDGAKDVNQPARYQLIGELLKDCNSVLDVGCGDGLLRGFLRSTPISRYTGIDSDYTAIEQAAKFGDPQDRLIWADAETWESSSQFDAVVLNEVLYYFSDPEKMLLHYSDFGNFKLIVSIYNRPAPCWQRNPNMKALKIARKFAKQFPHEEHSVEQNGKKWSVLVIHC